MRLIITAPNRNLGVQFGNSEIRLFKRQLVGF